MLSENIKNIRKSKGLSQEELALKLNVVRQTVSKWEKGLSVPDSDLLILLSETLETPVSTLLGETVSQPQADDMKVLAEKLEVINLQLACQKEAGQKRLHWFFILLCALTLAGFVFFLSSGSQYLFWDYSDPETAILGTAYHALEWVFARLAPFLLIGSVVGIVLTRRRS